MQESVPSLLLLAPLALLISYLWAVVKLLKKWQGAWWYGVLGNLCMVIVGLALVGYSVVNGSAVYRLWPFEAAVYLVGGLFSLGVAYSLKFFDKGSSKVSDS